MIINCGKRRLISYQYGWRIEIEHTSQKGVVSWREDFNPYPASLADACESLLEREFNAGPDITMDQLPEALKTAASTVRKYMELARTAA